MKRQYAGLRLRPAAFSALASVIKLSKTRRGYPIFAEPHNIHQMTEDQIRQYQEKLEENIRKHGYQSTFVFGKETPSFCYSTGIFKSFGIPEIFISSLPQNFSHALIKAYVEKFKDDVPVPLDQRIDDLTERFPVYLIRAPIEKLSKYVLSSIRFYNGDPYKYVQLIYPDTAGRFPNDDGYDYDQVVVGKFKS